MNDVRGTARLRALVILLAAIMVLGTLLAGCSSTDCLNCVDLPRPVIPTGVRSISGDNYVIIEWNDIVYAPYDGRYNENVVAYDIFRRIYDFGDEDNPDRGFDPTAITRIAWDENYDAATGTHWYVDDDVINGIQYEYAVAAVNAAGARSDLSYEFVVDAPLPMSPLHPSGLYFLPLGINDGALPGATGFGFDFFRAATAPLLFTNGRVTPGVDVLNADIEFFFRSGIPYVRRGGPHVRLQDYGVFNDGAGHVYFEGLSLAPAGGYSVTGEMEVIPGHIYVVEITGTGPSAVHYAKFGVDSIGAGVVNIIWAYQLIPNLRELSVPVDDRTMPADGPQFISL